MPRATMPAEAALPQAEAVLVNESDLIQQTEGRDSHAEVWWASFSCCSPSWKCFGSADMELGALGKPALSYCPAPTVWNVET